MTQNWENWEITQSGWLDPLYHYMNDMVSICWKIRLFVKYVQNHIGNELNMSKQRWIKSSCVLCKLVQLIPIIWHTKLFGQCYKENLLIFYLFCSFFNFFSLPLNLFWIFLHKIQKWVVANEISKICWHKPLHMYMGLITKHGHWYDILGCWVVGLQRLWYDLT